MTNQDFTFYTSADYWRELEQQFGRAAAGDRIAMVVMAFNPDEPVTATVMRNLLAAADRSADVHLIVDAYNFLLHPTKDVPGPLWWHRTMQHVPRSHRHIFDALEQLRQHAHGHVTVINKPDRPFTNPKGGRSHIKYTVVNDRVFIGGCNLHNTQWLDAMLSWQDQHIADYLFTFVMDLHRTESTQAILHEEDRAITLDDCTTLLIDAGKKRQSIIFDSAMTLIDQAEKSILMTCQYFPNSVTARHLAAARRRGVDVQIIYAHPAGQGTLGSIIERVSVARERLRVPGELFRDRLPKAGPGIHAKIIATEKGAIIGSNNYVYAGVLFGTAEMAVLRHDPAFSASIVDVVERLLTGTPLSIRK
jgi:phosphatidylserine/phosphatidylglycerophosphate/cardiolipin synthase-like enzyme